jgi:hypothetical protein
VPPLTAESNTYGEQRVSTRAYHARNTTSSGLTEGGPQESETPSATQPLSSPWVRMGRGARLGVDRTTYPHKQDPWLWASPAGIRRDGRHRRVAGVAVSGPESAPQIRRRIGSRLYINDGEATDRNPTAL